MTVYSIWHQIRTAALDDGTRSPTKLGSLPNIRLESPVYASMDNLPLIMGMRAVLHIVPFPKRTTIRFGCSTQTLKQKIRILISGQVGWIAPPDELTAKLICPFHSSTGVAPHSLGVQVWHVVGSAELHQRAGRAHGLHR